MTPRVERTVTIKLPVHGPGEGQRDAWTTHVDVERRGDTLRLTKSPGMSGKVAEVKLDDLRELVRLLDEDTGS